MASRLAVILDDAPERVVTAGDIPIEREVRGLQPREIPGPDWEGSADIPLECREARSFTRDGWRIHPAHRAP
jgi:hypothetical protein